MLLVSNIFYLVFIVTMMVELQCYLRYFIRIGIVLLSV